MIDRQIATDKLTGLIQRPDLCKKRSRVEDHLDSLDKSISVLSEALSELSNKIQISLLPECPMPKCENGACDIERTELEQKIKNSTSRIEELNLWVSRIIDRCTL